MLRAKLREQLIPVVFGSVAEASEAIRVDLELDAEDDATPSDQALSFVEAITCLAPKVVVLEFAELASEDVAEAMQQLEAADDISEGLRTRLMSELRRSRESVGQVAWLEATALIANPTCALVWSLAADFCEAIYEIRDKLEGEVSRSSVSHADIDAFAKKLACDPSFLKAKNEATRMLAAERFLGDESGRWRFRLKALVDRAQAIRVLCSSTQPPKDP